MCVSPHLHELVPPQTVQVPGEHDWHYPSRPAVEVAAPVEDASLDKVPVGQGRVLVFVILLLLLL